MANENWQVPLVEVADPFKLKKWAEDTGEVEIADRVFGIAECDNLLESYLALMSGLQCWEKLGEAYELAQTLAGQGASALENPEENARLFGVAADTCRRMLLALVKVAKKEAYARCQRHLNSWKVAFTEDGAKLAAAILVDQELYKERGPMTVGAAIARVRSRGRPWPDGLEEVVRWYLETIRVKYRKDFELKTEEVRSEDRGNAKGDGEPRPRCIEAAEKPIRDAR